MQKLRQAVPEQPGKRAPHQALRVSHLPGRLVAPSNTSIETSGCFEPRRSVRLGRSKRLVREKSVVKGQLEIFTEHVRFL
jgi:hypothetical protein